MKRGILVAFLCFTAITNCQDLETFSKGTNAFAVNLLKSLTKNSSENVLISPTSISVLLSLLQQGAGPNTAEQLAKALNLTSEESRNGFGSFLRPAVANDESVVYTTGTKMYVKQGLEIKPEFLKNAQENFQTEVENLDVAAPEAPGIINAWVSHATDGHIQDIIKPGTLTPNSVMVLVSAVFFSGKWLKPFKAPRENNNFFLKRKVPVKVPLFDETMKLKGNHEIDLKLKWVELPYQGEKYSMYVIIPAKRFKLKDIIAEFSGDALRRIINSKITKTVHIRMPKFDLKMSTSLKEPLLQMGLTDLFSESCDLSGIGDSLKVTEIMHEMALTVSENGTEAAAATGVIINMLSLSWNPDEMDFFADQPFLAFIVDKTAGVPVFAARINDPRA